MGSENHPARSPGCTFSSKKLTTFSWSSLSKHRPPTPFHRQKKQIQWSDMVTFLFSVHTITEAKQYAGLGRAEPGLEPGRWIFSPGHLTWAPWCSAATASYLPFSLFPFLLSPSQPLFLSLPSFLSLGAPLLEASWGVWGAL